MKETGKHRPQGMIQVPLARLNRDETRSHRLENWIIFAVSFLFFWIVGYQLITKFHIISFEALGQLSRAMMVWHNEPARLSAIGFGFPPLVSLAYLPIAMFSSWASSLALLPLVSAFFASIALVVSNRFLGYCNIPSLIRYGLIALLLLNPLFLFYASNGVSEFIGVALLVLCIIGLCFWYSTHDLRYLIGTGLLFGITVIADYVNILWLFAAAIMITLTLSRYRASKDEIEGSLITFLSPAVFTLALWTLFNFIILDNAFAWINPPDLGAINVSGSDGSGLSMWEATKQVFFLVLRISPLALLVLPALIFSAVVQKDDDGEPSHLSAWLAVLLSLAILKPVLQFIWTQDAAYINMREMLAVLILALIGAGWLYRIWGALRLPIVLIAAASLLFAIPTTIHAMENYSFQNSEQAFVRAIKTQTDQEGSTTRAGEEVGISAEKNMASYIKDNIKAENSIITDNAQTYGVIVLTGKPSLFYNRAGAGDKDWGEELKEPSKEIKHMLVSRANSKDLITQEYSSEEREESRFEVEHQNARYILYKIDSEQFNTKESDGEEQ